MSDEFDDNPLNELNFVPQDQSKMTAQQKKGVKKGQDHVAKSIVAPAAVGSYEKNGREMANSLSPLSIANGPKTHAAHDGTPIVNYENDYNQYLFPIKATLRAMGRLSDLGNAGAPMTPDKAAKPEKLSVTDKKDGDAINAFNDWSAEQTELTMAVLMHGASDMKLLAAVTGYQAAQQKMLRMRKEAEKQGDMAKKAEIDATVDTLMQIIEVSKMALNAMSVVEGALAKTWDPTDIDAANIGKNAAEQANIDDALAAGKGTRSKGQKGIDAATKLAGALKVNVDKAQGWLAGAGFGMRDLLILVTDGAKYDQLQKNIQKLDGEIKNLGLDIELNEIKQAKQALDGFSMELGVQSKSVNAERMGARKAAASFGQQLGKGQEGVMTMYVANAYEELSMFGGQAERERHKLDGKVDRLDLYLGDKSTRAYWAGHDWGADWKELVENVMTVKQHRDFFPEKVTEWQQRNTAWEAYLRQMTGSDLIDK